MQRRFGAGGQPGVKALTRARLLGVDRAYFRAECVGAASAILVANQAGIDIAGDWGGGMVASADGMRFVVPVKSLHARPNPKYFGLSKRWTGATWLNVISDRIMGLGEVVVPGTVRDSLYILDAIHNLDVPDCPEQVITDTASYSDIVFGLFAICGYQFSPRIADIGDTRLWRIPAQEGPQPSYGKFDELGRHTIKLAKVRERWDDMLRVAGSLVTGQGWRINGGRWVSSSTVSRGGTPCLTSCGGSIEALSNVRGRRWHRPARGNSEGGDGGRGAFGAAEGPQDAGRAVAAHG